MPSPGRTWALIGAGAAGTAVAALLARKGDRIASIWSRRLRRAKSARALIGHGRVFRSMEDAAQAAPWLLIAVPDGAIPAVGVALLKAGALKPGQTLIHLSGSQGASVLRLRDGVRYGAVHPIQTIPTAEEGVERLPGSFFGVEGPAAVLPELESLVRDLGGVPVRIPAGKKPLYHAAMVMASNHLVVLAGASVGMLEGSGIRGRNLERILPLMRGAIEAMARRGIGRALTGPVARGDASTVAAHLEALKGAPDLLDLYVTCARRALAMARLDPARRAALSRILA